MLAFHIDQRSKSCVMYSSVLHHKDKEVIFQPGFNKVVLSWTKKEVLNSEMFYSTAL